MGILFVNDMMSVKLNTEPFVSINTEPFVESWFQKKLRRVNAGPTGSRKVASTGPFGEEIEGENLANSAFFG